ncbi:Pr6Pr family membrane protein [Eudoraea chungangensis]|uniref:Pr6Pr family membrane protein n=1 Tax=Eudoraea chungangensis TaxID=1481905 RepID=UPI0023ECB0FF|nr:Pr6Pr family membrane protein [Eudoraea chungangensis]
MRKAILVILTALGWLTLIVRLYLRIVEATYSPLESAVQFFSYFTILTNLLVTIYCTGQLVNMGPYLNPRLQKPETLTALTAFILVVGIVYHIALKPIWDPKGLSMILSEIHHTIVPVGTLVLWILSTKKSIVDLKSLLKWVFYPIGYITFVLIRGFFSNFYPYPFLDVQTLGFQKVVLNSLFLLSLIIVLLLVFYYIGKMVSKKSVANNV